MPFLATKHGLARLLLLVNVGIPGGIQSWLGRTEKESNAVSKPRIGITSSINPTSNHVEVNWEYAQAVSAAGGVPMVISPLSDSPSYIEDVLCSIDGLLLSGGGDISPRLYGQKESAQLEYVDEARDYFEAQLTRRAYALNVPTLGICRGIQMMNVAMGGTLYQDLSLIPGIGPEELTCHRQGKPYARTIHEVELLPGSVIHSLYREDYAEGADEPLPLFVNSMHHQALAEVSSFLQVTGTCGSVVEAVESRNGHPFFMGVQWHPEYLGNAAPLFRALCYASCDPHA